MTPEEKAKEIYDKMKGFRVKNTHRKKCALVAVDEIINTAPCLAWLEMVGHSDNHKESKEWWQEVKQELEKL